MMGEAMGRQDRLFYEFCLDEVVPAEHLLRRIDAVLDLSWLRGELAPYYSHTGSPSVDPDAAGPRGLTGARDEFLLVATVRNLKRLIAHATIPPPRPAAA